MTEARGQSVRAQHRHLMLDQSRLTQAAGTPQTGGRGHTQSLSQILIAHRCVSLQGLQKSEVCTVYFFHKNYFNEIKVYIQWVLKHKCKKTIKKKS
jgi:hypothetical protein